MITSAACVGIGQLIMGLYSYLQYFEYDVNLEWIPLFCFSVIIFSGGFGVLPLPFVIISEIIPEKVFIKYKLSLEIVFSYRYIFF